MGKTLKISLLGAVASIALLTAAGSASASQFKFDPGFGKPGHQGTVFGLKNGGISEILPLADRSLVIGGGYSRGSGEGPDSLYVGKLKSDGSVATSFGEDGRAENPLEATRGQVAALARSADGFMVAGNLQKAWDAERKPVLYRLNADGSIDDSFVVYLGRRYAKPHLFADVAIDDRGRTTVVGSLINEHRERRAILVMRFRPDGRLDDSFGKRGRVFIKSPRHGGGSYGSRVFSLPGGRTLIGGNLGGLPYVARLRADGSFDQRFGGGDGSIVMPIGPRLHCGYEHPCFFRDMVRLPGGSIRVVADYQSYEFTWRPNLIALKADGRLDHRFADRGRLNMLSWGVNPIGASDMIGLPDSSVVVFGNADGYGPHSMAQRVTSRGRVDSAFGPNGRIAIAGEHVYGGFGLPKGGFLSVSEKWGGALIQKFRRVKPTDSG